MLRERPVSVRFIRLDSGREPVREWLQGMRREHRKAIGACQTPLEQIEVVIVAKKNVGSNFDGFLEDEGILEESTAAAVKRVIAFQLAREMSDHGLSKSELARRMETSRSALDRLLDPDNVSVTLQTLQSAVQALGGRLSVEIEFDDKAKVA